MSEYAQAIKKWKKQIGFNALQFPVYKKSTELKEWFRFDDVHTFISLRTNFMRGIGICTTLREAAFVELMKYKESSTKEEFNTIFKELIGELNGINIKEEIASLLHA